MTPYNTQNLYTTTEREATTLQYFLGNVKWNEIPFNLLPQTAQSLIMDNLQAFFPTTCPHCGKTDEAAFLTNIGMKHCQHCSMQTGYAPIANLPQVDTVKARIWQLCGQNLDWVNANIVGEGWLSIWNLYLKARQL